MSLNIDETKINAAFGKIDSHALQIAEFSSKHREYDYRLSRLETDYQSMCQQLITTETRIMDAMDRIEIKQDNLIAEENKRIGVKSAARVGYSIAGFILVIMQVAMLIKTFSI